MVRNLTSSRSGRAVPNQFVITTDKGTYFQSYRSMVAKVDKKGVVYLSDVWDYSVTTMRYLYVFLSEFGYRDLTSRKVRDLITNGTFKRVEDIKM